MANNYQIITIKTNGQTLRQALLDYYSLNDTILNSTSNVTNEIIEFDWSPIINFSLLPIAPYWAVNRINIVQNIITISEYSLDIKNNSNYPKLISEVTENSLIVANTNIYIPDSIVQLFQWKYKLICYPEWANKTLKNISSDLFSPYIERIIKEDKDLPFYTPLDFRGIDKKDNLIVANISSRIFVVSKAMDYEVINVTPFINDLTWNDSENGGNFSCNIISPTAEYNKTTKRWEKINFNVVSKTDHLEFWHSDSLNQDRILNSQMSYGNTVDSYKNIYFKNVLQKNDVVFIRGERFVSESGEAIIDNLETCKISDLVNKNWDMIAIIDEVSTNYNVANGEVSVSIKGRDLMAMLIEENTLVIPSGVATNGMSNEIEQFKANYLGNDQEVQKSNAYKRIFGKIQDITLTTAQPINVLIDWIFDKLSFIQLTKDENTFNEFKANNVYKSFEETINPSTYKRIGIWNLTSVWYDKSIKDRIISDNSLSTQGGNMISYIKKLINPPLVEFYTQTVGSYFHWIVRKAPFDSKNYKQLFETCNVNNSHVIKSYQILPNGVSLAFDYSEIYSVFRYVPKTMVFGNENVSNFTFPAIGFPELMDIYGVKLLELTSSYGFDTIDYTRLKEMAIQDLKFLIEITIYKMFSQTGSISIVGDRRIKKGQAIYLEPLDLLCYVKGISNQYSISEGEVIRTTVLQVERCIVMKHYNLYFNIVDFTKQKSEFDLNLAFMKDETNKSFIFDFFIDRKELDYDNDYNDIHEKMNRRIVINNNLNFI